MTWLLYVALYFAIGTLGASLLLRYSGERLNDGEDLGILFAVWLFWGSIPLILLVAVFKDRKVQDAIRNRINKYITDNDPKITKITL